MPVAVARMARFGIVDRFLVPLEAQNALRYLRRALSVPHSMKERIALAAGRSLFSGQREMAVSEKGTPAQSDLSEAERFLFRELEKTGTEFSSWILLRDYGHHERQRVIAFLFRKRDASPFAVMKARLAGTSGEALARETAALHELARLLPHDLARSVPRVLETRTTDGGESLLLSGIPGRSPYLDMHGSLAPRFYVRRHFTAAARWLVRFQNATLNGKYQTAVHGDFWARNLLLDEAGEGGMVDWEHFTSEGSPMVDFFHFPLTYGINYPWTGYNRISETSAFAKTFLERNHVSKAIREYLEIYSTSRGMSKASLASSFRDFLTTAGTMGSTGGQPGTAHLPWKTFLDLYDQAGESVFSG